MPHDTPISVPLGGFGNCSVFAELTTPGGRQVLGLGADHMDQLEVVLRQAQLVDRSVGIDNHAQEVSRRTGRQRDCRTRVSSRRSAGWLMISLANVL